MNNTTKKTALLGMIISVALVLAWLEAILPPIYTAVPGIKMGLPNLVILFVLYRFGLRDAITVSAVRILIVAILFGNFMTLTYSVAGAGISLLMMALLKKTDRFSSVGVSIVGAVCHNLGQIAVAIFLFDTLELGYYMFILAITGTLAGILIGIGASILLRRTDMMKI